MKRVVAACIWLSIACGSDDDKMATPNASAVGGAPPASSTNTSTQTDTSPGKIGSICTVDTECPAGGSGTPVCLKDWPSGYCAVEACADHGHDCPDDPGNGSESTVGGKCVLDPTARCLALCATDSDCRTDYSCAARSDAAGHASANVCVPTASRAQQMATGTSDNSMSSSGDSIGGNMMMASGSMMMGSDPKNSGMSSNAGAAGAPSMQGAGGASNGGNMNAAAGMSGTETHVHPDSAAAGGMAGGGATSHAEGMGGADAANSNTSSPSTGGMAM